MQIKNIIRKAAFAGVSEEQSLDARRAIIITNYLSLTLLLCLLILVFYRTLVVGNEARGSLWIAGMVVLVSPLILNRLRLTLLARIALCYFPVIYIWYGFVSIMIEKQTLEVSMFDGLRLYILSVSVLPYLIIERRRPVLFIVTLLPTLISLLFLDMILKWLGLELNSVYIHGDYESMAIRSFVGYLVISSGCFVLQYIIYRNDQFNRKLILELRTKTEELKVMNDELLKSKKQLIEFNLNLESVIQEKTASIRVQNESLIKYAYKNAHHVRGPIARILGLIQVSKVDNQFDYAWYLEKVKEETEHVDEIVRAISHELYNTTNNGEQKDMGP